MNLSLRIVNQIKNYQMVNYKQQNLFSVSALELGRKIKSGELSCEDLVRAHIQRIKKVDKVLHAVVCDRFDEAISEAVEKDRLINRLRKEGKDLDSLPPYFGVPCTVKETISVKGMPQTGGVYYRKDYIAEEDATVVRRLKDAGCIILGVTNVPELAMWMECYNSVYGRTNNPWDKRRTPGGSSGGEAALVGAGVIPFGIGSDIGGSIRMPAFFCGVFGHKPSSCIVPNTGHWPAPGGEAMRFLVLGPIARRAEDLLTILRIIAGPDGKDTRCTSEVDLSPLEVEWSKLKVLSVRDNGKIRVSREIVATQITVEEVLKELGCSIKVARPHLLEKSVQIYSLMLSYFSEGKFSRLMEPQGFNPYSELIKWLFMMSKHTLPAIIFCIAEDITSFFHSRIKKIENMLEELKAEIEDELGDFGIMLYPVYSRPAPHHYTPILTLFDWVYTAIINVLGFPSTAVPISFSRYGIPLGVQVISTWGKDNLCIAVAQELERIFGGWRPPKNFSEL